MRYRVVNLGVRGGRLGGMLDDYQQEITALKEKLNPGIYSQPGPVPVIPPPAPLSYPPPNPITPGGQAPPMSVATGYPTEPGPVPPIPTEPFGGPPGGCPPGTTWTPTGCLPNVPTEDRYIQPEPPYQPPPPPPSAVTIPPNPITPGGQAPPMSVATGYPTEPGPTPYPPPPPFTGDCPPGETMTPAGCRPDVATPGGGGIPGGFTLPAGLFSGGGMTASLFGLGAPLYARPIRLRRI